MKFTLGLLFATTLLFITEFASANSEVNLWLWHLPNAEGPLVLPTKANETPEKAATRYLQELNKNTELIELFEGSLPDTTGQSFSRIDPNNRETAALLIANLPKDFGSKSVRVKRFKKILSQAKQQTYILPITANLGLSREETKDFFNKLSTEFPLLIAMGGDDVDTDLYKQENIHAKNTNKERDLFEIQLLKNYIANEKGYVIGVCRGSQMSAVALGYEMIQDIPAQIENHISHADDWHSLKFTTTDSILFDMTKKFGFDYKIYSYHHQAVRINKNGPLEILATADDGVIEATGLKSKRGIFMQFHPELMQNQIGNQILWQAVTQKNIKMPLRCQKVF